MSSPLIWNVPTAYPGAVGVKATSSMTLSPGLMVVPSGSEVRAENSPPDGGFDFVIVTAVPPVLVRVKDLSTVSPTATDPKLVLSGSTVSAPAAPALPVNTIDSLPPLDSTPSVPSNSPPCLGSKFTVTLIEAPGSSLLPATGSPLALNGAPGAMTLLIVSGPPPRLLIVTVPER